MINMYDTPVSFQERYKYRSYDISFSCLMEVGQGGPLAGKLYINSNLVGSNLLFGGPFLVGENKLYAPLFVTKFCVSGFRLCQIDLDTLQYSLLSKVKPLIYLDHIENGKAFFF